MGRKITSIPEAILVPFMLAALLASGCAGKKNAPNYADTYRRLASNAVKLYGRIEPLRGSACSAALSRLYLSYLGGSNGEG